jgi:hypothetical protein
MEEKIKNFFEGAGKRATEHLGSGANILITIGKTSYALKITEEREIKVEKDGKERRDIEISGEEEIMNDLFSSSSNDEFSRKARSYIRNGKEPKGKILMERTLENARKFQLVYYQFLRKMFLVQ